jgi:hypothetical protein
MVAPIHSNRKGIYRDLYRELDSDNRKNEAAKIKKPRKGIYVNLYNHIENRGINVPFKDNIELEKIQIGLFQAVQKSINFIASKISYLFLAAANQFKLLLVAFVVAKKPINSYIENNLPLSPGQEQAKSIGIY